MNNEKLFILIEIEHNSGSPYPYDVNIEYGDDREDVVNGDCSGIQNAGSSFEEACDIIATELENILINKKDK